MFGNEEHTLWVEKWRPTELNDYVGNESIKDKIKIYLDNGDVPHLLLFGQAGTGKTTLAKLIARHLDCDLMYINASDENNVETVREKVKGFASTMGFKQWKVVILDECLQEGTLVTVLHEGMEVKIPIEKLDEENDLVKSYNIETNSIEWMPFYLWDNGEHEIWEIQLENGELIKCTENHKWFVHDENENVIVTTTKELHKYNYILSPV